MLAQQHTEHRRSRRILPLCINKMQSGRICAGGDHQTDPAAHQPDGQYNLVALRLIDFINSAARRSVVDFTHRRKQTYSIQWHMCPPVI